jgi:TonB family protein
MVVSLLLASTRVPAFGAQGDAPLSDRARYVHIARESTLEWTEAQPFLMKANFQLFDLDGNPGEAGTLEEGWGNGVDPHITIHSPSRDLVQNPAPNDYRLNNRESYLIRQVLKAIVRPIPTIPDESGFALNPLQREVDGTPVDCFMPSSATFMDHQAYCTDENNHLIAITGDIFVLHRRNFRRFGEHQVPMDIKLSYLGRPAVSAHITELDALPLGSSSKKHVVEPLTIVTGRILAGAILKKKQPKYPFEAKMKKIEGEVLLSAIIDKEGKIAALDVIASPHQLLTKSALDAVQTWTYKPYLLNGQPTEVDTTIIVNYNLNLSH